VGEHEMKQARGAAPAVPGKGPLRARARRATAGGHQPTPTARTRHCRAAANAQARQSRGAPGNSTPRKSATPRRRAMPGRPPGR